MDEAMGLLASERVGHLATIRSDGGPHLVPMVFALVDDAIVTAVDWKPKKGRLQRLANIEANPAISFLVHHYSDDWDDLWWVRVDGMATIHTQGPTWQKAIDALRERYHQYRERPPEGAVIWIQPEKVSSWSSRR